MPKNLIKSGYILNKPKVQHRPLVQNTSASSPLPQNLLIIENKLLSGSSFSK